MVNPLRGWGHGRDVTRRLHLRLLTVGLYRATAPTAMQQLLRTRCSKPNKFAPPDPHVRSPEVRNEQPHMHVTGAGFEVMVNILARRSANLKGWRYVEARAGAMP